MPTVALKPYQFEPKDRVENFHGAQLLFIGWEDHLMFCAPFALALPPTMPFGALIESVLPGAFSAHPDFERINWQDVEWLLSGKPWKPDPSKTLQENGLKHKDAIRFRTPGLAGIKNSCN